MSPRKSTRVSRTTGETPTEQVINKIALDELIKVVSLIDHTLVLLNTNGKAKYRFTKFGEHKLILYEDVMRLIEEHRSFLEKGIFMIADKRVVERHGLQEIVENLLDKNSIQKILNTDDTALELFKMCNPQQKDMIVGMLVRKMAKDESSVDANVINQISRASGKDIARLADDTRTVNKDWDA